LNNPRNENEILRLRVSLDRSEPEIWRELLVPEIFSLGNLHVLIQLVFGWEDYHLHDFRLGQRTFGAVDPEAPEHQEDEEEFDLGQGLPRDGASIKYVYDFGDNWTLEVKRVSSEHPEPGARYPLCVAGERAAPPEDAGGIDAFNEAAHAFEHPDAADPEEVLDPEIYRWYGDFDPVAFDVDDTNQCLREHEDAMDEQFAELDDIESGNFFDPEERLFEYDASVDPDPEYWLDLDEGEQNLAAAEHHELDDPHPPAESRQAHAMAHAVIETQLLAGDPPEARAAFERMKRDGLSRHDAIHAVSMVLMGHLFEIMKRTGDGVPLTEAQVRSEYVEQLEALTVEDWRAAWDADSPPKPRKKRRKKTKNKKRRR
jgi:hypothetical protein